MCFSCHRLCQKGFTRSWRPHQQCSLWKLCTDLCVLSGIVKEIYNFCQGLLRLVLSGHILKGNAGFLLDIHLGITLSNAHNATSAHALHGEVHKEQKDQERYCIVKQSDKKCVGTAIFPIGYNIVLQHTI